MYSEEIRVQIGKTDMDEQAFKKKYYKDDIATYNKASAQTADLWDVLQKIKVNYENNYKNYESVAKNIMDDILSAKELKFIHSVRYRAKDTDSLFKKFIKKKALLPKIPPIEPTEIEKYRNCDETNFYKVFTDLSGVRILLRYRSEWEKVDRWIRKTFAEAFVGDWYNDYDSHPDKNFIAEKPKVYYKHSEEDYYGQFDKKKFDVIKSKEEYNSIHYIINYNGTYVELQLRTILDEAWGECTHDIIYKGAQQDDELKIMAKCLSEQIKAAETITEIIYDKINGRKQSGKRNASKKKKTGEEAVTEDEISFDDKKQVFARKLDLRLNKENGKN